MNEKRPPLGIRPRKLHDEDRLFDIRDAIQRYTTAMLPIPQEWIDEYNELHKKVYGK